MILQVLDTTTKKQKGIRRGRMELMYDILNMIRFHTELPRNTIVLYARAGDKPVRQLLESCLDAGLVKLTKKRNYRRIADHMSLTPQGHQFLSHFDKICYISGYTPISERK